MWPLENLLSKTILVMVFRSPKDCDPIFYKNQKTKQINTYTQYSDTIREKLLTDITKGVCEIYYIFGLSNSLFSSLDYSGLFNQNYLLWRVSEWQILVAR